MVAGMLRKKRKINLAKFIVLSLYRKRRMCPKNVEDEKSTLEPTWS